MNEELAGLFRQVQDIPYRIQLTPDEPDLSCSGKNGKLTTWDRPLARVLPVTEWDGQSATLLAVTAISTYSPEESAQIMENETSEVIEADLKVNGAFYAAFNEWLERARRH